jgi:hypothetical protein
MGMQGHAMAWPNKKAGTISRPGLNQTNALKNIS